MTSEALVFPIRVDGSPACQFWSSVFVDLALKLAPGGFRTSPLPCRAHFPVRFHFGMASNSAMADDPQPRRSLRAGVRLVQQRSPNRVPPNHVERKPPTTSISISSTNNLRPRGTHRKHKPIYVRFRRRRCNKLTRSSDSRRNSDDSPASSRLTIWLRVSAQCTESRTGLRPSLQADGPPHGSSFP
jgi:hypothetical protein